MAADIFFQLLNIGLWENDYIDSFCFPISDNDWKQIYKMSQEHAVCGLIYKAICSLPRHLMPSQEFMIKLITRVDYIEARNKKLNSVIACLQNIYTNNGITAVLQKGQGVAAMYETPSLRECGDLDYYLSNDDMLKMRNLIEKMGIKVFKESDGSDTYLFNGVCIENHSDMIDINNFFVKGYLRKLVSCRKFDNIEIDENTRQLIPDGITYLLMLNTHILKHAMGYGIGLRQFCDMARAYKYYRGKVDFNEYYDICKKLSINKWTILLDSFLFHYLNLENRRGKTLSKKECDELYEIVMNGGNFGFANRKNNSSALVSKVNTLKSFVHKTAFSLKYSSFEYLGILTKLMWGQLQR